MHRHRLAGACLLESVQRLLQYGDFVCILSHCEFRRKVHCKEETVFEVAMQKGASDVDGLNLEVFKGCDCHDLSERLTMTHRRECVDKVNAWSLCETFGYQSGLEDVIIAACWIMLDSVHQSRIDGLASFR